MLIEGTLNISLQYSFFIPPPQHIRFLKLHFQLQHVSIWVIHKNMDQVQGGKCFPGVFCKYLALNVFSFPFLGSIVFYYYCLDDYFKRQCWCCISPYLSHFIPLFLVLSWIYLPPAGLVFSLKLCTSKKY